MTTLYRLYDGDGRLLYVGIAKDWASRMKQHAREKEWWLEVATTHFQIFTTRAEAEKAEARAIKTERPKHNIIHQDQPIPARREEIIWPCESCGTPIRDGDGYLSLLGRDRVEYLQAMAEWRERYPEGSGFPSLGMHALMDMPEEIRWKAFHLSCDPEPDGSVYHIGIERIRTPWDALHWTAHLMGKVWVGEETNWDDLLYKIIANSKAKVHA